MPSVLKQLSDLIAAAVDQIDAATEAKDQPFPSLDEPFTPESETPRHQPEVAAAIPLIVAAAKQLIATAQLPGVTLTEMPLSWTLIASLGTANDANIVEILRDAGPQGLHVTDIARKCGMDPSRTGRILRLLATNHIFRELAPDVFANNRLSSFIDTGKSLEEIANDPAGKYDKTTGTSAIIASLCVFFCPNKYVPRLTLPSTSEQGAIAGVLSETLRDSVLGRTQEPNEAAFQKAHNTTLNAFEWHELPENSALLRRLGVQMTGQNKMQPPDAIVAGFDFGALEKGALVVDVAGGLGAVSLVLAKRFPDLALIVEDRPPVIAQAHEHWKAELPSALESGRVRLLAADMFAPQPAAACAPAVFVLRAVLHDWADRYAAQILAQLRAAAGPRTTLLIIDSVLPYACADTGATSAVPGAVQLAPSAPLLANGGGAASVAYMVDVLMLGMQNGQERTAREFVDLLGRTGWELKEIRRAGPGGVWHPILVVAPV